jgi:hypothetical protein
VQDDKEWTPLIWAATNGNEELARFVTSFDKAHGSHEFELGEKAKLKGDVCMHDSAILSHEDKAALCRLLIEKGAAEAYRQEESSGEAGGEGGASTAEGDREGGNKSAFGALGSSTAGATSGQNGSKGRRCRHTPM